MTADRADRALLGLAHQDFRGRRYLLGRTTDRYAVWDGAAGGPPVEVFPLSTEGWTLAWHRYTQLESAAEPAPPPGAPYPLTVTQIVGGGFRLWTRHFWRLTGTAAILVIPASAVVLAVSLSTMRVVQPPGRPIEIVLPLWADVLNSVVNGIAFALVTAAVVRAGVLALQGRPPSVRDAYRAAVRRTGTIVLVTLVGGLAAAAPVLPGVVLWSAGRETGSEATTAAAVVAVALGLVPAIFLTVRFLLWPGSAVVEGHRGLTPLRRSWRLVRGETWRTLGAVLLAGLVLLGAAFVLFTMLFAIFLGTGGPVTESLLRSVVLWTGVASALLLSATLPLAELVIALLYVDARVRKEGLAFDTLAGETGVTGAEPSA
jgi:hypothetical protein